VAVLILLYSTAPLYVLEGWLTTQQTGDWLQTDRMVSPVAGAWLYAGCVFAAAF